MLTATRTTSITASEAISEAHNDPLDLANFANEVEDLHMQHADNYPANYPWINKERSVSRKLRHNSKNGKELLVLTLNFFVRKRKVGKVVISMNIRSDFLLHD